MVKRDGNLLTAHSPDHDLGEGSTSRWYLPSKQQTNEVEAGCRIDSNTSQKLGHGEIADQQVRYCKTAGEHHVQLPDFPLPQPTLLSVFARSL